MRYEKAVFIECSAVYIVTEPNEIKSDDRKTANDMFLGITSISATIFMCFGRLKNYII